MRMVDTIRRILVSPREEHERRQAFADAWGSTEGIRDFGELTARWLEGDTSLGEHPNGYDVPDKETQPLLPHLARLNRMGFVTTGSQPGHLPIAGWDGRTYQQRAAVEGFADAATADRIEAAANDGALIVVRHHGARWRSSYLHAVPVTYADGRVVTSFGGRLSRSDVGLTAPAHLAPQLAHAEQITVIDPQWGREDHLWTALGALPPNPDTRKPDMPDHRTASPSDGGTTPIPTADLDRYIDALRSGSLIDAARSLLYERRLSRTAPNWREQAAHRQEERGLVTTMELPEGPIVIPGPNAYDPKETRPGGEPRQAEVALAAIGRDGPSEMQGREIVVDSPEEARRLAEQCLAIDAINGHPPGTTLDDIAERRGFPSEGMRDELRTETERAERASHIAGLAADAERRADWTSLPEEERQAAVVRAMALTGDEMGDIGRNAPSSFYDLPRIDQQAAIRAAWDRIPEANRDLAVARAVGGYQAPPAGSDADRHADRALEALRGPEREAVIGEIDERLFDQESARQDGIGRSHWSDPIIERVQEGDIEGARALLAEQRVQDVLDAQERGDLSGPVDADPETDHRAQMEAAMAETTAAEKRAAVERGEREPDPDDVLGRPYMTDAELTAEPRPKSEPPAPPAPETIPAPPYDPSPYTGPEAV